MKRVWRPAVGSDLNFHDLRHSHVAVLIKQGEHPKTIANRLGHESVTTVLDLYGGLFDEVSVDDQIVEVGDQSETIVEETSSTVASRKEGRSVKMIVGGQSTDGLAKLSRRACRKGSMKCFFLVSVPYVKRKSV